MTATQPPLAKLAFVTECSGEYTLNIQIEGDQPRTIEVMGDNTRYERVRITKGQLANIVRDGVGMVTS